jgi:MFS family permease
MKLHTAAYITMNIYWFGLAFMWNALHPIVLPALLVESVPEALKNTYLGAMTFVGLLLAMGIQPLAGALSDRTHAAWGRRRGWLVGGTLGSILFLAVMARSHTLWILALGYGGLQIASNAGHGPAQGLIPDLVPVHHHGLASGIKSFFDMIGLVVTSLVAGQLMENGDLGLLFGVIAGVLALSTAVTVVTTREPNRVEERAPRKRITPAFSSIALPVSSVAPRRRLDVLGSLRHHPVYMQLLVARFLILLGVYVVQGFAQFFLRDWLRVLNPARVTGNLMAAIGVTVTLLVFPAGWLSDRIGRWSLNVVAGALIAFGIGLLVFAQDVAAVYAFGAVIGVATGTFLSVNWALATDLIPVEQGGKFLGFTNLATAGAAATSRLGGPVIDGFNALWPGTAIGYPAAFAFAALATLTGTVLLARLWRRYGSETDSRVCAS